MRKNDSISWERGEKRIVKIMIVYLANSTNEKKITFPTNWAVSSCFFLLKSLRTLNADAHVSAGHDHGVYEICHAYDALFIAVFHAERTQKKFKQQKIIMILEKYERNKLKKGMLFGCT